MGLKENISCQNACKNNQEQVNHYYSYGGLIGNLSTNPDKQKYKYNGKEYDTMHGLNTYDYGARQYDPARITWDRMDKYCEKKPWNNPYVFCSGNPINRIDPDGKDDYYTASGKFIRTDNQKTNNVYVADEPLMINGKVVTGEKFKEMASTIYAESSIGYGIADDKEMCAIASVHLRNHIAFGKEAPLAKKFRMTALDKQTENMQMANYALINAIIGGKDYSNGATQWDGAEQAMVRTEYIDKPSNGKFMYKMNTMGWNISNENYVSWRNAVNKKFGQGSFNVPQKKFATSNYAGMHNKGRIRLQSTAQYGLTIFWREVK